MVTEEHLVFYSRAQFRRWLEAVCDSPGSRGKWIAFGQVDGKSTLTPLEALEEALCFGWIGGRIRHVDSSLTLEYFAPRLRPSKWSERNKALAESLEARGLMTKYGREHIDYAKGNGYWDAPVQSSITPRQMKLYIALLESYGEARSNFLIMPPSVQRAYVGNYFDAKTSEAREKRLLWAVERLKNNLRPL